MKAKDKTVILVKTVVDSPINKVWNNWITPDKIVKWNNASDDWHTPRAQNDLWVGGNFDFRMEAKDGSMGFDFAGTYSKVVNNQLIEYTIADGRVVRIIFSTKENKTEITESFEAEDTNPIEMQRSGWQSILDNFKRFTETN